MNNYEFIETAENIYKSAPRSFMTFWKYREHLKTADVYDKVIDGIRYMYAVSRNRLVYYWSDDDKVIIDKKRFSDFDLIVLNAKYRKQAMLLKDSHDINEGIYQFYDGIFTETQFNDYYYVDHCDFSKSHFNDVHAVLNDGLGNMSMERIKGFTHLDVFDKDLWIIVREKETGKAVSIGICVYDKKLRETELEWIGVAQAHHGKGVGRMLIDGIIKSSKDKSDIIRVGGAADDFYYKCGFRIQSETGLWIKRKGSNVGWWD